MSSSPTQQKLPSLSLSSNNSCKGNCVPLYIYGGIAAVGIIANFAFSSSKTFSQKMWSTLVGTLWAVLFGALIWYLCKSCNLMWAYVALVVPSVLFGLSMLFLLLRMTWQKSAPSPTPAK